MGEVTSFASLESKLLAHKGSAKPAMRAGNSDNLQAMAEAQSALGWNDTGSDLANVKAPNVRANGAAHRAAFTLRLDADRHFKLRLASTLQNCSAQLLVTEALDRFLQDIPQLDSLAKQASQSANKS